MRTRMFNWFRPSCPVDVHSKRWIEIRLEWLSNQFGYEQFTQRPMILPLAEFFPETYDASQGSARIMLDRICGYMGMKPDRVVLDFYTDRAEFWQNNERAELTPATAGLYEKRSGYSLILLESTQLYEPVTLVGTMAHELAHSRLLGEDRITGNNFDNELLTDLTVVFFGLGIFLANCPRAATNSVEEWPWTKVPCPEYMTGAMFGYALAQMAWHRRERNPDWAIHLQKDAKHVFWPSLRYLWTTQDSKFQPRLASSSAADA